jgi:hypothetical protein
MITLYGPDPDGALAALEAGEAVVAGALFVNCDPPFRVWGGDGDLSLGGHTYTGIAARGLIQVAGSTLGSAAQSLAVSLSGIEPAAMAIFDASAADQASVIAYQLIFDATGTQLLAYAIEKRGALDQIQEEDQVGGQSTLTAMIESSVLGLRRFLGRIAADIDQRRTTSTDHSFKGVSYAGQITLYWAGHKPQSAGQALPAAAPSPPAQQNALFF